MPREVAGAGGRGPVDTGAPLGHRGPTPAGQGGARQEGVGRAVPLALAVPAERLAGGGGRRPPHASPHLLAPRAEADRRGAHIALHHPRAWPICQALKAAGVLPDFRTPDRLRLGFAPLYTRFADVHEGLRRLRQVVLEGTYDAFGAERTRVT